MAIPRSLRNELSKYRRGRKAGFGPGGPHGHFSKSRRYVSGMPYGPRRVGYDHNLYSWGDPREYHPNPNAPAAQSHDYRPSENWESHMISHSTPPEQFRPFPELPTGDERIPHEEFKSRSEFFLRLMEVHYTPFERSGDIPNSAEVWPKHFGHDEYGMPAEAETNLSADDKVRRFMDVTGALGHLQKALPNDHPDVVNLRTAFQDLWDDPELTSRLESIAGEETPSKLGTGDPYAIDSLEEAGQHFDQQIQSVERVFDSPMPEAVESAVPAMFEEVSPEAGGLERIVAQEDLFGTPPAESLEQHTMLSEMAADIAMPGVVPEQDAMPEEMRAQSSTAGPMPELSVFDIDPAVDEINQAIDEVTHGAMPQEPEPDPFQPEYDPYMMDKDMLEQMQYMANPFAMPGSYGPMGPDQMGPMPDPMMDPSMMPGPF